jgi:polysaccharide biosynthesis protein PslG
VRTARLHVGGRARALALAVAVLAALALAPRAEALPSGFWGVVPQATPNEEQLQRLRRGGVEGLRIPFEWGGLQSERGGPIDWGGTDQVLAAATRAGVAVLPVLSGAPSWAVRTVRVPGGGGSTAPAHLPATGSPARGWRAFLRQAVERYGPGGSFWSAHPSLPERPIRTWQIWNEPNFKYFVARPNPTEYGRLVRVSSSALRSADPGARVVLAGLFAQPHGARNGRGKHTSVNWFASDFLTQMYRTTPGIRSRFDGVALHPYTGDFHHLVPEIEEVRQVLRRFRDRGKGLWITELGWSSQRPERGNSFAKGPAGQAQQLAGAFRLLRSKQRTWNLRAVYWFSVDDLPGSCNFCDGTGLFGEGFSPKRSWYAYVRFAGGTP